MLAVTSLTMRFGGLKAVDDLSFVARANEITAVIGPNGAGKTTVFNCITGFYRPTEGGIVLSHPSGAHFALDRMPGHRIASRARVARTFQNIRLFTGMTVLENLLVAQHNVLMAASGFSLLAVLGAALPAQIAAPHFFAFGGALETARWMRDIAAGAFVIDEQGGQLRLDA